MLLVYEDFGAGLRARRVFERVVHQLETEADFNLKLWRFDLPRQPALLEQAVNEGSRADIVVLAAHGELPPAVRLWFDRWLARKDDKPCALAVSLDPSAKDAAVGTRIVGSLQAAVAVAGVDVFLHQEPARPVESETGTEGIPPHAETGTAMNEDLLRGLGDHPYRDRGINE